MINFLDDVDVVLALPLCSRVKTLSLICQKGVDPTQYALVNSRICNVLKRGVLEPDIQAEQGGYSLPFDFGAFLLTGFRTISNRDQTKLQ